MVSNPTGPPPHERLPGTDEQQDDLVELYGPLALTRGVKDDGRALLLYTHAEDEPT